MAQKTWIRTVGGYALWLIIFAACYVAANMLVGLIGLPLDILTPSGLLLYRLMIYIVTGVLLAGAFLLYYRKSPKLIDFGIPWWPKWKELGLGVAGMAIYVLGTMLVLYIATMLFGLNATQEQDLGFTSRLFGNELMMAFVVLVVLTPIFEEMIFRGFLYGRLRAITKKAWWVPALLVSALFGVAHGQWNVGLDVFVLSMVACALRELTGSIWGGVVLHMIKNMIAFMFTFVFINGIGG